MSGDLSELLGKLDALTGDTEVALKRGVLRACQKIQGDAKRLAIVDTGRLRASITASVAKDGGDIVGTVGTNVKYARYVEFGTGEKGDQTVDHTPKKSWRYRDAHGHWHTSHGNPAYPFLRPAFDANKRDVEAIIAAEIKKAIKG